MQLHSLSEKERQETLSFLWDSLSSLSTPIERENFLKELLSESETLMLARRIQIASMILQGNSFEEISTKIGAGKNTILSVSRWLRKTDPKKQKLIKNLEIKVSKNKRRKTPNYHSPSGVSAFSHLKRQFPLYFVLFNLLDKNAFKKNIK